MTTAAPSALKRVTDAPGVTPMMAQFLSVKEQAGEALLFYRMGDFYELFFEDAEKAAAALDIALTKRGKHLGEDIPMCGVPAATADHYLAKLIEKGFHVAVAEQTEDPKEAKKRGSKSVVARAIVRVVTPGTITEEALLDARAPAYLAAAAPGGLAWADVSTGEFGTMTVKPGRLGEAIAALAPRELLAPQSGDGALELGDVAALEIAGGVFTPWPRAKFDASAGERRLTSLFGVTSLEAFGDFTRGEVAAAGALVDYLELTLAGGRPELSPPRAAASKVMAMDPATRASLDIDRSQKGERAGTLLATIDRTVTGPGARALAARLARPLAEPAAISVRLDAVEHFTKAEVFRAQVRAQLKSAGDPQRALTRLTLGRGGPRDLLALANGLGAGDAIARGAAGERPPEEIALALTACALDDKPGLAALAAEIEKLIAEDVPVQWREGGFIRPGVVEALDRASAAKSDARKLIAALQARYSEETGISNLKVKHNNVLGYFIETSSRYGETLMAAPHNETFIHRQTMANAMRFSTTELAHLEGEIAGAADRARAIELELYEGLLAQAAAEAEPIRAAAGALATLDVAAGLAHWAVETRAVRPAVDASRVFDIDGGRHPVVEAALYRDAETFTPNDCRLDGAGQAGPRLMMVTGPNMAGKSTYLRQNALMVVLAQAGSFVPASKARIGVADRVFSRVGAADDLARGRSTFMVEMIETAAILNQATDRSLVILDEVGRGTATFDGLAIAWAAAEHLHDVNKARALFATHYHEMTDLAGRLKAAANASLRAKEWKGELVFLHTVQEGPADRSYGIDVARRAGLPKAAVARAQDVLATLEGDGPRPAAALGDLPLFSSSPPPAPSPEPMPDPLRDALDALNPDELTPRAALDALYQLKALGEDGE